MLDLKGHALLVVAAILALDLLDLLRRDAQCLHRLHAHENRGFEHFAHDARQVHVLERQQLPPVEGAHHQRRLRSEEHTSELQSLMRISYAVFCLKKKKQQHTQPITSTDITINTQQTE